MLNLSLDETRLIYRFQSTTVYIEHSSPCNSKRHATFKGTALTAEQFIYFYSITLHLLCVSKNSTL